jgi:acetyl esterase/lipase
MKTKNNFRRLTSIGTFILILVFFSLISAAQVYNPSDDAYVRGGSYSASNFGNESVLVIKKGTDGTFFRKSYLKFNLAGSGITGLQSAKIRLYTSAVVPFEVSMYETSDNWTESLINWDNAPVIGNLLGSLQVNAVGSYYEWDVTQYVLSQLSSDETVSVVCYDAKSTNQQISFNSKEATSNHPELVLVSEASFLPPKPPANLTATAVSWKQINLNWTDSSNNEEYFVIERKTNSGSFAPIDSTPSNSNHFSDTGLIEKSSYDYRVFSSNSIGISNYSNEVSVLTKEFVPAPDAPGIFTSQPEVLQFGFSWADYSDNENGFVVERKPQDGFYMEVGWPGMNATAWSNSIINGLPSPALNPDLFLTPRFTKIKTVSGVKFADVTDYKGKNISLYMDIYQPDPDTTKNRPVIMFIHGGGFRTGSSRTQSYVVRYCQDFAKRGYVCASIDYRLRDGTDMPTQASEFPALQDATRDANSALSWLRTNATEYGFDPNLMFLTGGSSGGRIGITLAYFDGPDEADLSINWSKSGIVALTDLWGSLEPEMRAWAYPANDEDIPTCIIHGTADPTIPYQNSLDLADELARADVSYELHPIEGAGHTPTGTSTDPLIEKWMADFFVKEWKKHISSIKTYTYRICSYNEGGYSAWSDEVTVTIQAQSVNAENFEAAVPGDFFNVQINPDKSLDLIFKGNCRLINPKVSIYNAAGQQLQLETELLDDRIRVHGSAFLQTQLLLVCVNTNEGRVTEKVVL